VGLEQARREWALASRPHIDSPGCWGHNGLSP
jgi:hypothetical protein